MHFLVSNSRAVADPRPRAWADADVIGYAMKISVWGRWVGVLVGSLQLLYRPDFWRPDVAEVLLLQLPLVTFNGIVHYRLATRRTVGMQWMAALSTVDLVMITAAVASGGGFDSYSFLAYYLALACFALVFSSPWLGAAWATVAAVAYTAVCLGTGDGLDTGAGDHRHLVARVAVMYLLLWGISMVTRFERVQRQAAVTRERQLQQDRIGLSQKIHDTAAQTAYMISLGIDGAVELADDSNPRLAEALTATSHLAKSAVWDLRSPIDSGLLFEGQALERVLRSHVATFAKIASIPAEMTQTGDEPPLPAETRVGLFSVAHNALANAFVHASATRVQVALDFTADRVRLSVADDGVGLPADYAERGRGFAGMYAEAARLGGTLSVARVAARSGTVVTVEIPNNRTRQLTGGRDVVE